MSPRSTEHFCSSECAFADHTAKARDLLTPGMYRLLRKDAAEERTRALMEVATRLKEGRARAKAQRGVYGEWCHDPTLCADLGYCPRNPTCAD